LTKFCQNTIILSKVILLKWSAGWTHGPTDGQIYFNIARVFFTKSGGR